MHFRIVFSLSLPVFLLPPALLPLLCAWQAELLGCTLEIAPPPTPRSKISDVHDVQVLIVHSWTVGAVEHWR